MANENKADEILSDRSEIFFPRIGIANFKAFGKGIQFFEIKPITLIYGPNSSGKSSFIHSLLYLDHAQRSRQFDTTRTHLGEEFVDLGGFKQLIHGNREERNLLYNLSLGACDRFGNLVVELDIGKVAGEVGLQKASINTADGIEILVLRKETETESFDIFFPEGAAVYFQQHLDEDDLGEFLTMLSKAKRAELPIWGKNFFPSELSDKPSSEGASPMMMGANQEDAYKFLTKLIRTISKRIEEFLGNDRISYLGPLRSLPKRSFMKSSPLAGERNLHSNGEAAWDLIKKNEVVREQVNVWLNLLFKNNYKILSQKSFDPETIRTVATEVITQTIEKVLKQIPEGFHGDDRTKELTDELDSGKLMVDFDFEHLKVLNEVFNQFRNEIEKIECDTVAERISKELIDIAVASTTSISIENPNGIQLSPKDVGVGVSQVIPLIAETCSNKRSVILIEQPEIHLHPAQQADLGDLFIENANRKNGDSSWNNFIIETHSQHILERIGRRIRDTQRNQEDQMSNRAPITTDDVAVYYIDPENPEGVFVMTMELTDEGHLAKPWPDGFFNEDIDDLF
jgi:predicted ATPase